MYAVNRLLSQTWSDLFPTDKRTNQNQIIKPLHVHPSFGETQSWPDWPASRLSDTRTTHCPSADSPHDKTSTRLLRGCSTLQHLIRAGVLKAREGSRETGCLCLP